MVPEGCVQGEHHFYVLDVLVILVTLDHPTRPNGTSRGTFLGGGDTVCGHPGHHTLHMYPYPHVVGTGGCT